MERLQDYKSRSVTDIVITYTWLVSALFSSYLLMYMPIDDKNI